MKVWVKLLIGSALGVALGFILPPDAAAYAGVAETVHTVALNIGRYTAVPLLFFGLIIGIYELRAAGKFWPLVGRTFLVLIPISILVISLGIAVTFIFPPERVPIITEERTQALSIDAASFFSMLFPENMLAVVSGNGLFTFPLLICAFFFAIGLTYDNHFSKPIFTLIDSLSRVFFHITTFFSEILGIVIIAISAYWALQYRAAIEQGPFKAIILLLLVLSLILGLLILQAMLYLLRKKTNPWRVLYGSLAPALASFFSGDIVFSLPVLLHSSKMNLGIKRRCAPVVLTLFNTFGRSGSAMVATVALIIIVKSYSILGISGYEILRIIVNALLFMFLLGRHSVDAAFICLAGLCAAYGNGFENSYLILKPMAFFLIAFGSFLDTMIASLGTYMVARFFGFQEERSVHHFV